MLLNDHRQWLYKGKDGRIFEKGEEIPEGYFDSPWADKWDNKPVQPKMKEMPVWGDTDEVVDESDGVAETLALDDPVPDDAPSWFEEDGKYHCNLCDHAPYSREDWFADHMLKKHKIVLKETIGVK
jgi:hypothetical protein